LTSGGTAGSGTPAPDAGGTNGDGAGLPDWAKGIPSELITDKVKGFKSPADLIRSYNEAQKLIGKKGVTLPGEDAKPEDWAAVYKALGRPESPDKYEYAPPDGMSLNTEQLKATQTALHGLGLSQKQFEGVMNQYVGSVQAELARAQEFQKTARNEAVEKLQAEFGNRMDAELAKVKGVVTKYGLGDAFKAAGLANDYKTIRAMIDFANAMGEDQLLGHASPAGIDEQIAQLKKSDAYQNYSHPGHAAAVAKKMELITLKHRAQGAPV